MLRSFTVTDNGKGLLFSSDGMKFDEAFGIMQHHMLNICFKEVFKNVGLSALETGDIKTPNNKRKLKPPKKQ